jgi:hypothetical protein
MDIKFLKRVDASVKTIMRDGKIDQNDIPELVMLITDLSGTKKMTSDQLAKAINELFDYIMDHYKLFPEGDSEKANFKKLFDMSVKLILFTPNLKKMCSGCLAR